MKVVVTGGHHSSALPVVKKLQKEHPEIKIYWFGHKYSALGDQNPTLEFREITGLGIPFYHINAGKFYRTFNVRRLIKIPYGFFQSLYLLIKIKPNAIMSFGGYIAVPTVMSGYLLGIPSITHEQTVVAGWANRLIANFVGKVLISWKESEKYFPKGKTYFVGLPLRKEIFSSASQSFHSGNGLPTIYVTTGKIGSHIINTVVGECLNEMLKFYNIIHQCGDNSVFNDFDKLSAISANKQGKGLYFLRKFIFSDEIGEAYSVGSLVISRSGAHTTAELLALKKPCIVIPIPWVSHNEQNENAGLLVKAGLGTVIPEKELTPNRLVDEVRLALKRAELRSGEENTLVQDGPDPTDLITGHLLALINK